MEGSKNQEALVVVTRHLAARENLRVPVAGAGDAVGSMLRPVESLCLHCGDERQTKETTLFYCRNVVVDR